MSIPPPKLILIFLYAGATELDFIGPMDAWTIVSALPAAGTKTVNKYTVKTCSLDGKPLATMSGIKLIPDYSLDQVIVNLSKVQPYIFLVPGARSEPTMAVVGNKEAMEKLLKIYKSTTIKVSVCTGAYVLAQLGFLNGLHATTNKQAFCGIYYATKDNKSIVPPIQWESNKRFVCDWKENICTSSGVSAGTDLALEMIKHIETEEISNTVQQVLEWNKLPGNVDPYKVDKRKCPKADADNWKLPSKL